MAPITLPFFGKTCTTFEDVLRLLAFSPEAWSEGKTVLRKGELAKWLDSSGDCARAASLAKILALGEPLDLVMVRCQLLARDVTPLIWAGEELNPENLRNLLLRLLNNAPEEADRLFVESAVSGWFLKVLSESGRECRPEVDRLFRLGASLGQSALKALPLAQRTLILFLVTGEGFPDHPVAFYGLPARDKAMLSEVLGIKGFLAWARKEGVFAADLSWVWHFVAETCRLKGEEPGRVFLEKLGDQLGGFGQVLAKEERVAEDLVKYLTGGAWSTRVLALLVGNRPLFGFWHEECRARFQLKNEEEWKAFARKLQGFLTILERESAMREYLCPPMIEDIHRNGKKLLGSDQQLKNYLREAPIEQMVEVTGRPEVLLKRGRGGLRDWQGFREYLRGRGVPEPTRLDVKALGAMTAILEAQEQLDKAVAEWTILSSPDGVWSLMGFVLAGIALPIGLATIPALLVFGLILVWLIFRRVGKIRMFRHHVSTLRAELTEAAGRKGAA